MNGFLSRLVNERQQHISFVEQLQADAAAANDGNGRDLSDEEQEMVHRRNERVEGLARQITAARQSAEQAQTAQLEYGELATLLYADRDAAAAAGAAGGLAGHYRSAGQYVADYWRGSAGDRDAMSRIQGYARAVAHQTTADNPGLLPEPIVAPVINFVDNARPLVSALGPRPLENGPQFYRPKVTQHTQVGEQTAEKTELASRKLLLTRLPVDVGTLGGYLNISRQNIDWSSPAILDIVINDLASEYAIETEQKTAADVEAAAIAGPSTISDASTAAEVAKALWGAAGLAYANLRGAGRLICAVSPDMLGVIGPLFAPVNPQNAQSAGFSAGSFGQGAVGAVSGISVVMSAGLSEGTVVVVNTAAFEIYENRLSPLQVVEPSVLGVQVAYAGYFADLVVEANGIVAITAAA